MRLATLTLHPAIDRLLDTAQIQLGGLFDVRVRAVIPAGKGINTARVLRRLTPQPVSAAVWLGDAEAPSFARFLKSEGVAARICPRPCATRWGVTILETKGRETHFKETMPPPDKTEERVFLRFLSNVKADAMAVCGSAPPGTSKALLRRIMQQTRKHSRLLVVDSSGPLLKEAGRVGCDGLKGNAAEIGEWLGLRKHWDPSSRAHRNLIRDRLTGGRGAPKSILITLGARGAALARRGRIWIARPPRVAKSAIVSPTGCGDASTAGWLWAFADQVAPEEALRRAIACGTAKLLNADPGVVDPRTVKRLVSATVAVECW